jgi:hypothetical protein
MIYDYVINTVFVALVLELQGDRKVAQPAVWHLVLAKNEGDEVELVGECVGMTVQKLCTGKHRSRDVTAISAVALKQCVYRHVFFTSAEGGLRDLRNSHLLQTCGVT